MHLKPDNMRILRQRFADGRLPDRQPLGSKFSAMQADWLLIGLLKDNPCDRGSHETLGRRPGRSPSLRCAPKPLPRCRTTSHAGLREAYASEHARHTHDLERAQGFAQRHRGFSNLPPCRSVRERRDAEKSVHALLPRTHTLSSGCTRHAKSASVSSTGRRPERRVRAVRVRRARSRRACSRRAPRRAAARGAARARAELPRPTTPRGPE